MILENHEQVKHILKDRFVNFKNAAKKLKVNYEYLSKTINGYEGYNSVFTALGKANIPVVVKEPKRKRKAA